MQELPNNLGRPLSCNNFTNKKKMAATKKPIFFLFCFLFFVFCFVLFCFVFLFFFAFSVLN